MIDFENNWDTNLEMLVKRRFKNYEDIYIDLATARTNFFISQAGDFLTVISSSHQAANCQIKINTAENASIDLLIGKTIQTIFKGFYLSNNSVDGAWLIIRIGIIYIENETPRRAIAKAAVKVTNVAANTDTQPASHLCDKALIKADNRNTNITWVNFGIAAVQGDCIPLEPGESISIDIDNTNQIHCNFVLANEIAFIVYEV